MDGILILPQHPKEMAEPTYPEWLTNLKWLWGEFKTLIVPSLLVIFGIEWKSWRVAATKRDEEKKTRAAETSTTLASLSDSITKLTETLERRDVHFGEQFKLMNDKIDNVDGRISGIHNEFKDDIKSVHGRIDAILDKK